MLNPEGGPAAGHLALIGAGPGDPELMTLKGLRLLRMADVVLYDRLAPRQLLDEAPAHAEKIDVGKFPGRPTPSQPWINSLIIEHALAGKRIARLKGGDPFVFGRGGEELLAAIEAGIPVDIAPGVTAGIAVPGTCGVPVTHRGVSRAVALVTAVTDWDHPANAPGSPGQAESQIDSVAQVDTICIYMGLSQIDALCRRLIERGRSPQTPAMSVASGCTPKQREVVSTLEHLAADVAAAGLASPVLTVVGDVVALREGDVRPVRNRRASSTPRLLCWTFTDERALRNAVAQLPTHAGKGEGREPGRSPEIGAEILPITTCQRSELFILTRDHISPPDAVERTHESADAALRLFQIASGALSDVPGERAVAAQVRKSLRRSLRRGLCGSVMSRLARRALRAGESLRDRAEETAPVIELPQLLARALREGISGEAQPSITLLGGGALGRSVHDALTRRNLAITTWATRRPRPGRRATTSIEHALAALRNAPALEGRGNDAPILIAALAGAPDLIDAAGLPGVFTIDLSEPGSIRGAHWILTDVIKTARGSLAPQADAVERAAHRLPALAEAALAECLCPAIKAVNRAIADFRKRIIDAELERLGPMLSAMDDAQAETVRRSIRHAAARCAHPLHEYVNALGRQGRADDARLVFDHLLGSRMGFTSSSIPREGGDRGWIEEPSRTAAAAGEHSPAPTPQPSPSRDGEQNGERP